jgi:hypothetical protein
MPEGFSKSNTIETLRNNAQKAQRNYSLPDVVALCMMIEQARMDKTHVINVVNDLPTKAVMKALLSFDSGTPAGQTHPDTGTLLSSVATRLDKDEAAFRTKITKIGAKYMKDRPVAWVIFHVLLALEGLDWPTTCVIKSPLTADQQGKLGLLRHAMGLDKKSKEAASTDVVATEILQAR